MTERHPKLTRCTRLVEVTSRDDDGHPTAFKATHRLEVAWRDGFAAGLTQQEIAESVIADMHAADRADRE